MKNLSISILLLFLSISVIAGNVSPKGEFADIDVKIQNKIFTKLSNGNSSTIEKVLEKPEDYNPTVLYALSNALFEEGRKDEAMFWFYSGQLRARSDANKSLDRSAGQGVALLNQKFGSQINQYAFTNIPRLEKTIEKVIVWDKKKPRNYDPRWISLHGMDVFTKKVIAFENEDEWPAIDEKTRNEYLSGFKQAMAQMKSGS